MEKTRNASSFKLLERNNMDEKNFLLQKLVPHGYTFVRLLLPAVLCFYLDIVINRNTYESSSVIYKIYSRFM